MTRSKSERDYEKEKGEAQERYLKPPTADVDMGRMFSGLLEEDAPEFHERFRALTRLGDESVAAVLLFPDEQRQLLVKGQPTVAQARELLRYAANVSTRRAVVHIREHGSSLPRGSA